MVVMALSVLLSACASRGSGTSATPQTLMLAVAGSFDRSADSRERPGKRGERLRRVTVWTTRPPVQAREVRVTYDNEQRTIAWRLDVLGHSQSLKALTGARDTRPLGAVGGGKVAEVVGGPFAQVLAVTRGKDLTLVSKPYALRYEPALRRWAWP